VQSGKLLEAEARFEYSFGSCVTGGVEQSFGTGQLFQRRIESRKEKIIGRMKHQNLQDRTKQFALLVIKLCEKLPRDDPSRILGRQLLRAACSVGANYRAACQAKSKADFISKMGTVLEEADETGYWLDLLADAGKIDKESASPLMAESKQLVAISISSIQTAKRNAAAQR
jgi:four helix bundle protein